jgi:flavin reductase (DIM6/NTAB) family NADH-FMN oxidoreductase RutF
VNEIAALFRQLTSGVYVIGVAAEDGGRNAFTANSVMQVSYRPLLLAVSVNPRNMSHPLLVSGRGFTVNVLKREQFDLARHFGTVSGRERDKLAGIEWRPGRLGSPILVDALAFFECRTIDRVVAGDHDIFVGEVRDGSVLCPGAEPLTYAETGDLDGSTAFFPPSFQGGADAELAAQPEITFDQDVVLDVQSDAFVFFGRVNHEPIQCAITREAMILGLHVPAAQACLPESFAQHRERIHSIAVRLIRADRWEPGGGIVICRSDV